MRKINRFWLLSLLIVSAFGNSASAMGKKHSLELKDFVGIYVQDGEKKQDARCPVQINGYLKESNPSLLYLVDNNAEYGTMSQLVGAFEIGKTDKLDDKGGGDFEQTAIRGNRLTSDRIGWEGDSLAAFGGGLRVWVPGHGLHLGVRYSTTAELKGETLKVQQSSNDDPENYSCLLNRIPMQKTICGYAESLTNICIAAGGNNSSQSYLVVQGNGPDNESDEYILADVEKISSTTTHYSATSERPFTHGYRRQSEMPEGVQVFNHYDLIVEHDPNANTSQGTLRINGKLERVTGIFLGVPITSALQDKFEMKPQQ